MWGGEGSPISHPERSSMTYSKANNKDEGKAKDLAVEGEVAEGFCTQCHLFTKRPSCLESFVSTVKKMILPLLTEDMQGLISECLPAIWKMKSVYC